MIWFIFISICLFEGFGDFYIGVFFELVVLCLNGIGRVVVIVGVYFVSNWCWFIRIIVFFVSDV